MRQVDARTGRGERGSAADAMAAIRQRDRAEPKPAAPAYYEQPEAPPPASETRLFEGRKKRGEDGATSQAEESPHGSTERTSRLLDAKRRARKRAEEGDS
jgi:hypothetical protein